MKANQRKELERLGLQIGNQHRKKRGWWWMGTRLAVQIHEAVPRGGQNEGHTQASSHGVFCVGGTLNSTFCMETVGFRGASPWAASWVTLGRWLEERPGLGHLWFPGLFCMPACSLLETKSLGCLGLLVYESPLAAVSCFCAW